MLVFLSLSLFGTALSTDDIPTLTESSCSAHEYLDLTSFNCTACDPRKSLVPSDDKFTCICDSKSILTGWDKEGLPICKRCRNKEIPTEDQRHCIPCPTSSPAGPKPCLPCGDGYIRVEKTQNGSLLHEIMCIRCSPGTIPNKKKNVCISCPISMPNCTCSKETHEMIPNVGCIPKSMISSWPRSSEMFDIYYTNEHITSKFFQDNLLSVLYKCKMNNVISCQYLSNMCVLNLYQDSSTGGPCSVLKDSRRFNDVGLPKVHYGEGDAPSILHRKTISKRFTLDSTSEGSFLSFMVSKWHLNGTWIGHDPSCHLLQLCPLQRYTEKIRFASEYINTCVLPAKEIVKKLMPTFYELYLHYHENNQTFLHPIPILILNYKHHKKFVNKEYDMSQWQLTKRLFDVDTIAGHRSVHNTSVPYMYRYLKSVTLSVSVRNGQEEGMIYPPLLSVTYGELTKADVDKNVEVKISFKVHYHKPDNVKRAFDISLGVLCSLSVIWSLIRTWSNTKRSGQRAIDLVTVLHLCIIASGHLSNVFFLVSACAAVHSFVYYKWQIIAHVLLPSAKLTYLVRTYIIVSFPLKIVEVLYVLWNHLNIDIFLIDWEQPRIQKQQNFSVSAWRTYFVSNKWNEIQTERKTSLLIQISFTVLFLNVWGFENWALCVPELHTKLNPSLQHYNNYNKVHRFAIGVLIYCFVYILQSVFIIGLYERYIKNPIQEFVDFCSLANISVFILSLENFGYYIHGRSVHGFSDTDMATLKSQLRREEEDLVGHRGLLPASDHQTFRMLIPPKLRFFYRSLLPVHKNVNNNFKLVAFGKDGKAQIPSSAADFSMQSYVTINRFLAAFIEHALKDLDYEVKEKLFIEALLDIELWNVKNKGTLYNDNGHSFDDVLYYGNESTLFTFNLIMFSFVEILCQDFLFAAIITVICDEVVARIRRYGGRKNFSKKTLIDEQFLL